MCFALKSGVTSAWKFDSGQSWTLDSQLYERTAVAQKAIGSDACTVILIYAVFRELLKSKSSIKHVKKREVPMHIDVPTSIT